MALDLSMKTRKRSYREEESDNESPIPVIRTIDVDADELKDANAVLDLSITGATKRRTMSQSSNCSDISDVSTSSVARRLERTSLQSHTPPTVPTHGKSQLLNNIKHGAFVVPGPYSPTLLRVGSISAGNSPAAGTASGSHFLFPPPIRGQHSLSPSSSQAAVFTAPSTLAAPSGQDAPYSSYSTQAPSSPVVTHSPSHHHYAQLHAALVQYRRSLTPPSLTPPSHRRLMASPGIPLPTWSRLQAQHMQRVRAGSTSTCTDSDDEGCHTPIKHRTRSETSIRQPPFLPFWSQTLSNKQQCHLPSTSSVSDTPPSSPEGHTTPPTPTTADDDDDVFITLPLDPRTWSRDDVQNWLKYMETVHGLKDVKPDRFLMNGKALCLMNANLFACRVPVGGKLLFRDFRTRLAKAMAVAAAKVRKAESAKNKMGANLNRSSEKKVLPDAGSQASIDNVSPKAKVKEELDNSVEEKENLNPTENPVDTTNIQFNDKVNIPESPTSSLVEPKSEITETECNNKKVEPDSRSESPILDVTTVDEEEEELTINEDVTINNNNVVTPVSCTA